MGSAHNSEGSRGEAEGSKTRERQPVEGEESRRVARQPGQVTKPYKAYQAPARRGDQGGYQATRNRGAYSQQGGNTRDDDRRRRDRRGDGSHDNGSFSRGYSKRRNSRNRNLRTSPWKANSPFWPIRTQGKVPFPVATRHRSPATPPSPRSKNSPKIKEVPLSKQMYIFLLFWGFPQNLRGFPL